jgi:proteasome lid subunit RPN8/RPN11
MRDGLVILPGSVRRALLQHARAERPLECCGLLVGRAGQIVASVPSPNIARSAAEYRVDDRLHIDLRRVLRRFRPQLDIVGVYHSHPRGPATPSPTDLARAMYPSWVYVIVGLAQKRAQIAAFVIRRGAARRVQIRQRNRSRR